jgi:2,5-dioxopentanoate dehydrogenase
MPPERRNFVDGEWVASCTGDTFLLRNPADRTDEIARFQRSGEADLDRAVAAAVDAQPDWAATPPADRGQVLTAAASRLADDREELAAALTREEGKPPGSARNEVDRVVAILRYYAQRASDFRGTVAGASAPKSRVWTRQDPVGVAGLITPWNYPIGIPGWKLAPAIATGNTVVVKPASQAPDTLRRMVAALDEAGLPAGVVNYVTGSGPDVAAPLVEHTDVDAISFTGSTQVGEGVYADAVRGGKRVQTELGGKNPTVVTQSADLDKAVEIVGQGAFAGTGQSCTACSRAIVHEAVHDAFLDRMVAYAADLDIGVREGDVVGPHVTADELEGTLDYVEIGEREGATLETGGEALTDGRFADGHYVTPAVFSGVAPDMRLAQEEIFGPVLGVIQVANLDEALAVANGVDYGLSASIVTTDHAAANRFLDEIEAGVAKVNDTTTGLEPQIQFGGLKRSSSETWREQGDAGLEFYTLSKTVYENF